MKRREWKADAGAACNVGAHALLALGIDNLVALEEVFGEAIGAEILAEVERRLRAVVALFGSVASRPDRRLLVRLPGADAAHVGAMFEALQAAAAADAIETGQGPVAVTLSGGFALVAAADAACEASASAALQALHLAMKRGVASLERARDDRAGALHPTRPVQAVQAVQAVRAAIGCGDGRLAIAFQPVVRASGTLSISFHECLVRLQQPEGDLLPAAAFMPEIERLGLAPLVDRQVLGMTFDALARHPNARLSINVFPQTIHDRQWMTLFEKAAARHPVLAERLIIEMTESCSMLDPARTRAFMDRLRGYGVSFAIDDFGAKQASLHYLRDFRFDILKVDARLVRDIEPRSDHAFFVETLVSIARRFDMMTVAETVQGHAEARCLAELGIEHFQGFYFGSPSLMLRPTLSPMPSVAAQA